MRERSKSVSASALRTIWRRRRNRHKKLLLRTAVYCVLICLLWAIPNIFFELDIRYVKMALPRQLKDLKFMSSNRNWTIHFIILILLSNGSFDRLFEIEFFLHPTSTICDPIASQTIQNQSLSRNTNETLDVNKTWNKPEEKKNIWLIIESSWNVQRRVDILHGTNNVRENDFFI